MIHLLLYDGDCGFCSGAVRFVLNRDHAALLRLVPRPALDLGYRLVARVRHCLGGTGDRCDLSEPRLRSRFITEAVAREEVRRLGA